MPVDQNGLFEAIVSAVSKLPPALIVVGLLGGPTAIWIIARLVNPPTPSKVKAVTEDLLWVCAFCRSINEDRLDRCYSCREVREAADVPLEGEAWEGGAPRIGIPVGPGRRVERPAASSWLGAELHGASRPIEERIEMGDSAPEEKGAPEPVPVARKPRNGEPRGKAKAAGTTAAAGRRGGTRKPPDGGTPPAGRTRRRKADG
jgi:hypothetical protein